MHSELPIPGPLSLGDLLDRSFRLYRARFGPLLLTAGALLVPFGIITGLLMGRSFSGYMSSLVSIGSQPEEFPAEALGGMASYFGQIMLLGLLSFIVGGVVTVALTFHTVEALHERPVSLGDALRVGWGRLWVLIRLQLAQWVLITVATGVILVPLFILFAIVGVGLGVATCGSLESGALAGAGMVLALICGYIVAIVLALIPTVFLQARWIAAVPGVVAEKWGPIEALTKSWGLTRGRSWRSIGYMLLLGIMGLLVTGLPVAVIQQVMIFTLPTGGYGLAMGVSTALSTIIGVVWQPLYVAALVLYYYDLRVRREGYDLALRVQQMTTGPDAIPPAMPPAGPPAEPAA